MTRADAGWLTFWATFGIAAYQADRHGVALCDSARHVLALHTLPGRIILGSGLVLLYAHVTEKHVLDRTIRLLDRLHR